MFLWATILPLQLTSKDQSYILLLQIQTCDRILHFFNVHKCDKTQSGP